MRTQTSRRVCYKISTAAPLTIEGVAAPAEYYGEIHATCENELGEEDYLAALANIGRVLRGMAVRS